MSTFKLELTIWLFVRWNNFISIIMFLCWKPPALPWWPPPWCCSHGSRWRPSRTSLVSRPMTYLPSLIVIFVPDVCHIDGGCHCSPFCCSSFQWIYLARFVDVLSIFQRYNLYSLHSPNKRLNNNNNNNNHSSAQLVFMCLLELVTIF